MPGVTPSPLQVVGNLLVAAVAVLIALAMGLPVVRQMNDGTMDLMTGGGPISSMMVYVLSVPILLSLCRGVLCRAATVLGMTGVGVAVGQAVGALERGDHLLMGTILIGLALALAGVVVLTRRWRNRRRQEARSLGNDTARLMSALADNLTRRHGAGQSRPGPEDPLQQVHLVERLAFGVLAQAAVEPEPRLFAQSLVEGLAEVRDSIAADRRNDPAGIAAEAADIYYGRVRAFLRSRGHPVRPRTRRRQPPAA